MTQADKDLLLKDLCARLPYGVICHANEINLDGELIFVNKLYNIAALYCDNATGKFESCPINDIKPYLRPMSSMTEKEEEELRKWCRKEEGILYDIGISGAVNAPAIIDYLNAHHFDFRNLIERGLAIEAQKDMYNE